MLEKVLIEQASPTLAGIKTASMFPCRFNNKSELMKEIADVNCALHYKGVRLVPVKVKQNWALLYLYRPSRLEKDLDFKKTRDMLKQYGYSSVKKRAVCQLVRRFKNDEFPHEVGLFLGYPPEDVEGFVKNKGYGAKCVGCWKVYGDEEKAKKCFARYKKCTRIYNDKYANGCPLEKLTVGVI